MNKTKFKNTKDDSVFYVRFTMDCQKWASKKLYSKTKPTLIK